MTGETRHTVGLVVTCYERTYREVLAPGFFPGIVRMNDRPFDAVVALVNNVSDPLDAHRRAEALVAAGELTSFAFVSSHVEMARRHAGLPRFALRRRPYLLDFGLVMAHVVDTDWLLGWDAETSLTEPTNWVDPAILLMETHPEIFHVSLNWQVSEPGAAGLAQETVGNIGDYALNWGFSDQLFLVRRRDLTQCRFKGFAPAALVRHAPHPYTFEYRVECAQRASGRLRATYAPISYQTNHMSLGVLERTGRTALDSLGLRARRALEYYVIKRLPRWLGPRFAMSGSIGPWPRNPGVMSSSAPGLEAGSQVQDGTRPAFSLVHATYHRESGPLPVRDLWLAAAAAPDRIEYVVALDSDDEVALRQTSGCRRCVGSRASTTTAVRNWNAGAALSTGSLIVVVADDLEPPDRWDEQLLGMMGRLDPWRDAFAVKVVDSPDETDSLMRHPVVSRAYYDKWGLFSFSFSGVYCDDDITRRAFWRSVIIDGRHLKFRHVHPTLDPTLDVTVSQGRINRESEYVTGLRRMVDRWPRSLLVSRIRMLSPSETLSPSALSRWRMMAHGRALLEVVCWAAGGVAQRNWRRVQAERTRLSQSPCLRR